MNAPRLTGGRVVRLRNEVFDRDDDRCIDCGPRSRRWPRSMLEADHDNELADGGDNDLANYVTRCLDHHAAKTEERRMARTATAAKKQPPKKQPAAKKAPAVPTRGARSPQTAQLPDEPPFPWSPALFLVGAGILTGVGVSKFAPGHLGTFALTMLAACTLVLGPWLIRWARWCRVREAQRVYERLCKPAGALSPAARRHHFKVTARRGFTPTGVRLVPGRDFDPHDERAMRAVGAAFAGAVSVHPDEVSVRLGKNGRVHVAIGERADARAHDQPPVQEPEPLALTGDAVAERIAAAVTGLIDAPCQVVITGWHDDGAPAKGYITYPSSAAKDARDHRADLPVTLTDLYAPRTDDGRWHIGWESQHDRFTFEDKPDPLAPVVPLAPIDPDLDLARGVNIGIRENGDPWYLSLLGNQAKHTLVAGESGAGKGSVLWGVVRGLKGRIDNGTVLLWALDPKNQDLVHAEPLAHRCAYDPESVIEALGEAVEAMQAQADRLKRDKVRQYLTPTRANPFNVILVDEIANLTVLATPQEARDVNMLLGKILTMGRSSGFFVIAGLQNPSKETLKLRDLFNQRIGMSLAEATHVDMVLGRGARSNGAFCDTIDMPGVCYVTVEGQKGHTRTRAAFVDDNEIACITTLGRAAPAHARAPLGEQLALPEAARGGEPVHVGEVLAEATTPARAPIPMRKAEGARGLFRGDDNPVAVLSVVPEDEDDPEGDVEVTYRYVGETQEAVTSFEPSDLFTPTDA